MVFGMIDCGSCQVKGICDAHVLDGGWKHLTGIKPCVVPGPCAAIIDAEECQKNIFDLRKGK
jgi:hypothetical protein